MKLVRDRIPEITRLKYRTETDDGEYRRLLFGKLQEEIAEAAIAASADVHGDAPDHLCEELGDVVEVCEAIAKLHGIAWGVVLGARLSKRVQRGSFDGRKVID